MAREKADAASFLVETMAWVTARPRRVIDLLTLGACMCMLALIKMMMDNQFPTSYVRRTW